MYYYILDYAHNQRQTNFHKKLKQVLSDLNINGEMAISSPARGPEEIAQMALDRGYTTIVAVGGDLLVNRLVSVIAGSQAALGVIPYDLSSDLGDLFCGNDLKGACLKLRQRKTHLIKPGLMHPNTYFLSNISVKAEKPIKTILEVDEKYALEAVINDLSISRELQGQFLTVGTEHKSPWWKRSTKKDDKLSVFQASSSISISTLAPISVTICDYEVAKTPTRLSQADEVLKIIVSRDIIQ
ncbi:MAG: diacylglycerol kinase family protein [bacterium]|nr:diacylglycerol kinase family protein [bacterium]